MTTFTLPSGCNMRITASMEAEPAERHRWSIALYSLDSGVLAEAQANYGSRIGRGETQRIDAAPHASSRRCEIGSTHETREGWEPDVAEVTLDTPDDLSISFRRPSPNGGDRDPHGCVLAIQFSPSISRPDRRDPGPPLGATS